MKNLLFIDIYSNISTIQEYLKQLNTDSDVIRIIFQKSFILNKLDLIWKMEYYHSSLSYDVSNFEQTWYIDYFRYNFWKFSEEGVTSRKARNRFHRNEYFVSFLESDPIHATSRASEASISKDMILLTFQCFSILEVWGYFVRFRLLKFEFTVLNFIFGFDIFR